MKYISIIGDVKGSKQKHNTLNLFEIMEEGLNHINQKYDQYIAKVFGVTKGDEFQGLLFVKSPVCEILDYIRSIFENIEFRYGIGIGSLETGINSRKSPIGSNGTVWWFANQMVETIKLDHEKGIQQNTDTRIYGLANKQVEQIINQSFVHVYNLRNSWTKQQRHIIYLLINQYQYVTEFKQIEAADILDIDSKYLNKVLKATRYYDYIKLMCAIQTYIQGEKNQ